MRTALSLAAALFVVVLLAGCGSSPPSKFYVLTADPATPPTRLVPRGGRTVALGRINLPPDVDKPQIARRRGVNQVTYSEEERWAGPLDEMVRRVLADDLAARLPGGAMLVESGSPSPAGVTIAVEISRFDADERGTVTLAARWETIGRNDRATGPPGESTILLPGTGTDAGAVATTMSRALAALAERIAAGLR